MAIIQRPTKQGNATTYQGKVAAGYTKILAAEVDADLDLIYSAWNQGVDSVNIQPGSITGDKLAPGAVGTRELQDGGIQTVDIGAGQITTPILADGSVTHAKIGLAAVTDANINNVTWNKISGGVLQGSVPMLPKGELLAAAGYFEMRCNLPNSPQYDNTLASWIIRGDYLDDVFQVLRAPPPGTAFTQLFGVHANGLADVVLAIGSVGRTQIAVNAVYGSPVAIPAPASFILSTANQWTQWASNVPITTRGGNVLLYADTDLSVTAPVGGAFVWQRWLRDGTLVQQRAFNVAGAGGAFVPLPGINCMDYACPAGAHTYVYQVMVGPSMTIEGTGNTAGGFLEAVELG
jgi:hypothetical protein